MKKSEKRKHDKGCESFEPRFCSQNNIHQKLIKEVDLDITLMGEKNHREVRQAFRQNPGPKLIQMCDEKAK